MNFVKELVLSVIIRGYSPALCSRCPLWLKSILDLPRFAEEGEQVAEFLVGQVL